MTDLREKDIGKEAEPTVVTECHLPHPPEKVWRALTVPELVAAWLMPNDIDVRKGARFSFRREDAPGDPIECEILEAEPFRRLAYSWQDREARDNALTSTVTFELVRAVGGTRLRITHAGAQTAMRRTTGPAMSAANMNLAPSMLRAA